MGQLTVDSINPQPTDSWRSLHWVVRAARWQLTCGFCRTRVQETGWWARSFVTCPACGTRNLLPHTARPVRK
jgi:hypothetical protein